MALTVAFGQHNSPNTGPNIAYKAWYNLGARNSTHQQITFYIKGTFYKGAGSTSSLGTGSTYGIYMQLQYSNGSNIAKINFKKSTKKWAYVSGYTWRPSNTSDSAFENITNVDGDSYVAGTVALPVSGSDTSSTYSLKAGFFRTNTTSTSGAGYIKPFAFTVNLGPRPSYTITCYKNYPDSDPPVAGTITVSMGDTTRLSLTTTRVGYTFKKWNTAADGSGTSYTPPVDITPTGDMNLYAIWEANNYYLDVNGWLSADGGVNYSSAGGIGGYGTFNITVGSSTQTGISDYYAQSSYGTAYSISGISALPGHTYVKVYSGSASGNVGYPGGTTTTSAGQTNVVLQFYAHKYTIQYDANGGSGAPNAQTKYYGTAIYLSSTTPTRTGYTFQNWNTKADGSGTTCTPGQQLTSDLSTGNSGGTAVVKLYAQWTMNPPTNARFTSYQVTGPFNISLAWACDGYYITNYTVYYKTSTSSTWLTAYSGTNTSMVLAVNEETTYNFKVTASNAGGSSTSSTITLTTPADQAKIRIYNGSTWLQGKTYIYNGSTWVKAKKVYIYDGNTWKINSNN